MKLKNPTFAFHMILGAFAILFAIMARYDYDNYKQYIEHADTNIPYTTWKHTTMNR